MVVVDLAAATICFLGSCYPALLGHDTPAGVFSLSRQATNEPGYGGDLLVFKEDSRHVWAIHRVYVLNPSEHRVDRLRAASAHGRRGVTRGCVNVMPEVYRRLVECCAGDALLIR